MARQWITIRNMLAPGVLALLLQACSLKLQPERPTIQITRIPQADQSGSNQTDVIEGRVSGAQTGDKVVLYAQTGTWWVQPLANQPITSIGSNSRWINGTHLGTRYAALLVDSDFVPAPNLTELPGIGNSVKAQAVVDGQQHPPSPIIEFSGYKWRVRTAPSNRGGGAHPYSAQNAWTDGEGALHLRISGGPSEWTCAELALTQSLGYGTYTFVARDVSRLEPAAVLAFFTYDYAGGDENHREVNIEVSRWGDPASKNAQYIIQPFHVPTNVSRFAIPPGRVTSNMQWQDGRIVFTSADRTGRIFHRHEFLSGTPSPGLESARIALYTYNRGQTKLTSPAEVVIEKFAYLP